MQQVQAAGETQEHKREADRDGDRTVVPSGLKKANNVQLRDRRRQNAQNKEQDTDQGPEIPGRRQRNSSERTEDRTGSRAQGKTVRDEQDRLYGLRPGNGQT